MKSNNRLLTARAVCFIGLLLVAFNGAAGEVSTAVLGVLIFLGGLAERIAIAIEKDG